MSFADWDACITFGGLHSFSSAEQQLGIGLSSTFRIFSIFFFILYPSSLSQTLKTMPMTRVDAKKKEKKISGIFVSHRRIYNNSATTEEGNVNKI